VVSRTKLIFFLLSLRNEQILGVFLALLDEQSD